MTDEQMIPLSVLREYMPKLKDEDLKELGPVEYDQSKVPEVSKKHAENVRRKVYLTDMTESFARGVEYAGLIASESVGISNENKSRQDTVETQFNSIQQEMTDKDVISAPEIIAAREGETTLTARLDKDKQEVNAKLTQTNEKIANMITIDFDLDCGGVPDGETNNYQAFISLKERIEDLGNKNVRVNFTTGGVYNYKPLLPLPNGDSWRDLIQPIDAENIFYNGNFTKIVQVGDTSWNANGTPSGMLEHESPIQFRRGKKIIIEGLDIIGARIPYTGTDGSCSGIYMRATEKIVIRDVKVSGWGTDGMTFSRDYNNGDKCNGLFMHNVEADSNRRQGVSITGADNVSILHSTFKNTNGGSFGHGLDLETNVGIQKNFTIYDCNFINNERGALNFIGTKDVTVDACYVDEQIANGAFYFDARDRKASNIKIINTTISTAHAVCYLGGTNVEDVLFENNDITTTGRAHDGATIRLVPDSENNSVDNIQFIHNKFKGIGGIYSRINGKFVFEDNDMVMSNIYNIPEYTMRFEIENEGIFKNSKIHIDESVVFSSKYFFIGEGVFEDMDLKSHVNALVRVVDDRYDLKYKVDIGFNKFSEHFYYLGETSTLTVREPQFIIEKTGNTRKVHGGVARTTQGKNARKGDIIQMFTDDGRLRMYYCTVGGTPGTWVMSQVP